MKKTTTFVSCALLFSLAWATRAKADGFIASYQAADDVGRSAYVGVADTPTAVYLSPAGISQIDGFALSLGGVVYVPVQSYTDPQGQKFSDPNKATPPPHLYATYRINSDFTLGLGFNAPYGLNGESSETVNGVANPVRFVRTSTALAGYNTEIVVAYSIRSIGLTIAAGPTLVRSTLELKQDLPLGDVDGHVHASGAATGFGGTAGLFYQNPDFKALRIGASYISRVKLNYSGSATISVPADFASAPLPKDGDFKTSLEVPDQIKFGVAYDVLKDFNISADFYYDIWEPVMKSQVTTFSGNANSPATPVVLTQAKNWKNTVGGSFGLEYRISDLALRLGYLYIEGAVPPSSVDISLIDTHDNIITVGAGYKFGNYGVDLGLGYILPASRTTGTVPGAPTIKGSYDFQLFFGGLTFTYHWLPAPAARGRAVTAAEPTTSAPSNT
jgi:long-chain fatty acid transport protein